MGKKWVILERKQAEDGIRFKAFPLHEFTKISDCPITWAERYEPELVKKYLAAEDGVDSAFFAKDMGKLITALDEYKKSYMEMVEVFYSNCKKIA